MENSSLHIHGVGSPAQDLILKLLAPSLMGRSSDEGEMPQVAQPQRRFHHTMRAATPGTAKTRRKMGASCGRGLTGLRE